MRAISLPFRLDSFGNITTTTDLPKIWADRVKTVVGTAKGERVMQPDFGCDLPNNLLDVAATVPGYADSQIQGSFSEWLPEVEFQGTEVLENDAGTLNVNVLYQIPNYEQTTSTTYSVIVG